MGAGDELVDLILSVTFLAVLLLSDRTILLVPSAVGVHIHFSIYRLHTCTALNR